MKAFSAVVALLLLTLLLLTVAAYAGGPLLVGGPNFGTDGKSFTWNPSAMPIHYRVDSGPLSSNAGTNVISNATGLQRVSSMLGEWQSVGTAKVSFVNDGQLQASGTFTGGHVTSPNDYNELMKSCNSTGQNPIVFDADGSLMKSLGLGDLTIGFAGICTVDATNGYILSARAMLNGKFQDGVTDKTNKNYELSADQFDEAITHEFGHFLGLDHSQINVNTFYNAQYSGPSVCTADAMAGLPLMFPIAFCPARKSVGLPVLAPDDVAWISKLYPNATTPNTYGTISGYVLFPDGVSHAQGVNVIARRVDDPATAQDESLAIAVSVVSGYLFTGNPGQSVTAKYLPCSPPDARGCKGGYLANNSGGDQNGSRNPLLIGYYEIPVPPGDYTVEVEQINPGFHGGSSVGPLDPPIPFAFTAEFWNSDEGPSDNWTSKTPISVGPGQTIKNINIILNGSGERFDSYEDGGMALLMIDRTSSNEVAA